MYLSLWFFISLESLCSKVQTKPSPILLSTIFIDLKERIQGISLFQHEHNMATLRRLKKTKKNTPHRKAKMNPQRKGETEKLYTYLCATTMHLQAKNTSLYVSITQYCTMPSSSMFMFHQAEGARCIILSHLNTQGPPSWAHGFHGPIWIVPPARFCHMGLLCLLNFFVCPRQ